MKRRTRVMAAIGALGLFGAVVPVIEALPAGATVNPAIVVTTTADVINGGDGVLSLREAVTLANATAGADTIQLTAGATYDLTICGTGATVNDNAEGDLDTGDLAGVTITGSAAPAMPSTIHQSCARPLIEAHGGPLTLSHLGLLGGQAAQYGAAVRSLDGLTLDHADQSGASGAYAVYVEGGNLSMTDSAIHDNAATGLYLGCCEALTGSLVRSSVRNNVPTGTAIVGGIEARRPLTLDHSEVTGNGDGRPNFTANGGLGNWSTTPVSITNSSISGNSGVFAGGILGEYHLTDSKLNDNSGYDIGGALGRFTIVRSTVAGNHARFLAGGLEGDGTITDSTISGNVSHDPTSGDPGTGGGIVVDHSNGPGTAPFSISNSTVTGNTGAGAGGIVVLDDWHYTGGPLVTTPTPVSIVSSTIAGNTLTPLAAGSDPTFVAPVEATDLAFARYVHEPASPIAGTLTATASVFGSAASATPSCSLGLASPVTSGGYNFSADGSCVGGGTGDVTAGGNPGLSGLADHGGPTWTLLPQIGSPLIDRIPSGFSTCGGTSDQRGIARPDGPSCDIGAVEADSPVANVIVVTTASDTINGGDGLLSLREAVALANATPGFDAIELADGVTYDLTICGATDDSTPNNSIGDLNATEAAPLAIVGSAVAVTPPTIHQTCPQRVIYASTGSLSLQHLHLTGGTAVEGAAVRADGPLSLDHVDESGASAGGGTSWTSAAVYAGSRPVSIVDSEVHDNQASGIDLKDAGLPNGSTILRTSVHDNTASSTAVGGGIFSYGPFTLADSEVTANSGGVLAAGVVGYQGATITNTTISGNHDGTVGGVAGDFSLVDSTVENNTGKAYGGALGAFVVTRSTVSGNHGHVFGGGLTGSGSVTDSTVSGNVSDGLGGGIGIESTDHSGPGPTLTLRRSTVTGNTGAGGIVVVDDWVDHDHNHDPSPIHHASVVVDSSTVTGNVLVRAIPPSPDYPAPMASELVFLRGNLEPTAVPVGSLTVTSSVIGSGGTAIPACSLGVASPVTSGGYNFSADGSCVGGGVGDVVAGGDPGLSGLADHGGSTLTLAPTVGSPLLDRIPSGHSSCAGQSDQRGVSRPVGGACDVGAVESDGSVWPSEREFSPIVPQRLMDSRSDAAYHVGSQHRFGAGETQSLVVAGGSSPVPVDASAVVVNVTVVGPDDSSHVDVWPTGTSQPNVSNVNFVPGQTVANLVKVKVGAGGKISLFNRNGHVDVIVDVVGYYRADVTASSYTAIVPKRITDTRADPAYHVGSLSRLGASGDVRSLKVTGGSTGVPSGATAIIANVTVVGPSTSSHLDIWPDGTSHPNVSNINYSAGQTVANLVVVKVSAGGKIDLVNANGSTDVIIDVVGYFTVDPTASGFVAVTPHRLADTRADPAYHVGSQGRLGDRFDTRAFVVTGGTVPADAKAIVVNITVVGPSTSSHLDAWPAGTSHPNVSNINFTAGQTVPNLVTVKIGTGGAIDLQNQNGSTDIIIDIVGYYR